MATWATCDLPLKITGFLLATLVRSRRQRRGLVRVVPAMRLGQRIDPDSLA
jgi:hypothetical protein